MSLLDTSHQQAFRSAPLVIWPGIGWVRKVGEGAGVYTFVSVNDAGHCKLFPAFKKQSYIADVATLHCGYTTYTRFSCGMEQTASIQGSSGGMAEEREFRGWE